MTLWLPLIFGTTREPGEGHPDVQLPNLVERLVAAEVRRLEERSDNLKELWQSARADDREALAAAKLENDRRLDDMNELRAQINQERGTLAPREQVDRLETSVARLQASVGLVALAVVANLIKLWTG